MGVCVCQECIFVCVCEPPFQEMSCCLSKRFSVKAIHRLLPVPPPLLDPASRQRRQHLGRQCQEPACPLVSAEQMSLNCPPPPPSPKNLATTTAATHPLRHPNRQPAPPCQAGDTRRVKREGVVGRTASGRSSQRGSVFFSHSAPPTSPPTHPSLPNTCAVSSLPPFCLPPPSSCKKKRRHTFPSFSRDDTPCRPLEYSNSVS